MMIIKPPAAGSSDLSRLLLRLISESDAPIGQGALTFALRAHGIHVSVPTVGRRLQDLEFTGHVRKASVDGRVITEAGRAALQRWDSDARLRESAEALVRAARRSEKKDILDLLFTRRVLEREAAALAAAHATPRVIDELGRILDRQEAGIEAGGLAIDADVAFHLGVADASKNPLLRSLIALLRDHGRYNAIVTSMRSLVGSRFVVDHRRVLAAIRARDARAAHDAMDDHLASLAEDLDRIWGRAGKRRARRTTAASSAKEA